MRPELLSGLLAIARGQFQQKQPATPVTPVTGRFGYRSKPLELQQLQPLQAQIDKLGKQAIFPETEPETALPDSNRDAIDERAALCAGCVPAIYQDAWARMNHVKPPQISDAIWYRAVNDGGLFLDRWGQFAELWRWTVGDLFDAPHDDQPGGLFWFIAGATVDAFGPEHPD